jgi:GNAT superfamily N-acetyltransferase
MVGSCVRACHPSECAEALALLDEEFIFSRGRTLSFGVRFAAALGQPDARMLLMRTDGRIDAALLVRPFGWITPERDWRAAMVGLVWTRPECRGRGQGSELLREAESLMRASGIEFAVLWTTRPGFYARCGWIAADCGALGHWTGGDAPAPSPAAAGELWPAIHTLRESLGGERVARDLNAYAALLPPATEHDANFEHGAYALIGRAGATGYVYEIGGRAEGLPAIWSALRRRYRELYLNLRGSSAAQAWLSTQPGIDWQEQKLAMWLPLSAQADAAQFGRWYLPFLDRI